MNQTIYKDAKELFQVNLMLFFIRQWANVFSFKELLEHTVFFMKKHLEVDARPAVILQVCPAGEATVEIYSIFEIFCPGNKKKSLLLYNGFI